MATDSTSPARTNVGLPNVGPGAGTVGGAGVASIVLDGQGRVTAATAKTYLADPGTTGFISKFAIPPNNAVARTFTSSGGTLTVTNGDGVAGNPNFDVATHGVAYANIQQGAGLSVLGVTGSSAANLADIVATGGTQCLQTNSGGTAVVWAACPSSGGGGSVTNVSGTAGQVTVVNNTTTPVISLVAKGAGAGAYGGSGIAGFSLDAFGAVTAVTTATYLTSTGTTPGTYNNLTVAGSGLITGASVTSWTAAGNVMVAQGLAALPTGDPLFTYDPVTTHTMTLGGGTPISLPTAGTQFINKTNGALAVGTSDANETVLYTSNTNRLTIDASGNTFVNSLAAGGIAKAAVTTGQLGIAVAGVDYQAAGNYITALTGDGAASGPGSAAFTLANTGVTANTYGGAGKYIQSFQVDAKGRLVANPVVASGAQAVVWKFFARGEFLNTDPTNHSDAFAMADGDSIRWAGAGGSIISQAVLNSETTNSAPYYTNNITPDANGSFQAYLGYASGTGTGSASIKVDLLAIHGSPGNSSNYTDLATCTISPTQTTGDNIGSCSASVGTSFSAGDLFTVIVSRADTNASLSLNNISIAATLWIPQ